MEGGGQAGGHSGKSLVAVGAACVVVGVVLGVVAYALLTSKPPAAERTLSGVTITPDATGPMDVGTSRGFNATAYDQDLRAIGEAAFLWSLDKNLGTLSSLSANHTSFAATAVGTETIAVAASYGGSTKNDTEIVTIIAAQGMGISISRSGDGTNWILLVSSTPPGKTYTGTTLALFRSDGSTNLSATPFGSLSLATHGCALSKVSSSATTVQVGDRILCKTAWYFVDSEYQISDGTRLLAAGRFR